MPRSSLPLPSSAFWCRRNVGSSLVSGPPSAACDRAGQGGPRRRALEAELRAEAGDVVAVDACSRRGSRPPTGGGCRGRGRWGAPRSSAAPGEYGLPSEYGRVGSSSATIVREQLRGVAAAPGASLELLLPAPVHEAPEVLVAAVPEHEGRVRGQAGDVLAGLRLELVPERLLLGVRRAGQQEVLPDQQAALVAELVEVLGLVDPAAPDADEVEVGVDAPGRARCASRSRVMRVSRWSSGIQLAPLTKIGRPLIRKVKAVPCVVGAGVQLDGAEADAAASRCRAAPPGPARRARP